MSALGPRKVAQLQPEPKGIKVRLLENMNVGGGVRMRGDELELYREMAEVEYLATQGILLIVDPAWKRAVIVESEQ